MGENRYSQLHARIAEHPASIDEQIRAVEGRIEAYARWLQKEVDGNRLHPDLMQPRLKPLRSVLITLKRVRDGELVQRAAA